MTDLLLRCQQHLGNSKHDYDQVLAKNVTSVWKQVIRAMEHQIIDQHKGVQVLQFFKISIVRDTSPPRLIFTLTDAYARRHHVVFQQSPPGIQHPVIQLKPYHGDTSSGSREAQHLSSDQWKNTLEALFDYVGHTLAKGQGQGMLSLGKKLGQIQCQGSSLVFRAATTQQHITVPKSAMHNSTSSLPEFRKGVLSKKFKLMQGRDMTTTIEAKASRKESSNELMKLRTKDRELQQALQASNLEIMKAQSNKKKQQKQREKLDTEDNLLQLQRGIEYQQNQQTEERKKVKDLSQTQQQQAQEKHDRLQHEKQVEKSSKDLIYFPFRSNVETEREQLGRNQRYRDQLNAQLLDLRQQQPPQSRSMATAMDMEKEKNGNGTSQTTILPRFLLPHQQQAKNSFVQMTQDQVQDLACTRFEKQQDHFFEYEHQDSQKEQHRLHQAEQRRLHQLVDRERKRTELYADLSQQVKEKQRRDRDEKHRLLHEPCITKEMTLFPMEDFDRTRLVKRKEKEKRKKQLDQQVKEKNHRRHQHSVVEKQEHQYFLDCVQMQLTREHHQRKVDKKEQKKMLLNAWEKQNIQKQYSNAVHCIRN